MGFGVYLSPWDRNAPVYGDSVKYNDFFTAQLTELLTRYGTIDELWFDGANGEGPNGKKQWYDFNRWYQLIRKLQPAAVIAVMGPDVRWVGTETGIGRLTEWSVLPLNAASQKELAENSQQEVNVKPAITGSFKDSVRGSREQLYSSRGLVWYPAETDVSIRPGWFYHPAENSKVKSPENLMHIYLTSVGRNGVLLLNVPPDTEGLINAADVKALEGWKQLFDNTFTKNLLQNARFQNKKGASVAGFTDGKLSTYVTTQQVTALLPAQISFNLIKLQENIALGQHIEQFTVEAWIDGSWQTIAEGTTVGYKRLLKLNKTITTNKIRFSIPATRATPLLRNLGYTPPHLINT
ncbi:alpha-L-fucosidase [Niabella hibiscisoli]|uniref:alpha-L-fucosidase n=1 Tax=Niabella hibiscisoli TaxID=1825928 RepID=UPI00293F08BB|nr:alpha-L-fucosidase [Niabella hibiscisoli]